MEFKRMLNASLKLATFNFQIEGILSIFKEIGIVFFKWGGCAGSNTFSFFFYFVRLFQRISKENKLKYCVNT